MHACQTTTSAATRLCNKQCTHTNTQTRAVAPWQEAYATEADAQSHRTRVAPATPLSKETRQVRHRGTADSAWSCTACRPRQVFTGATTCKRHGCRGFKLCVHVPCGTLLSTAHVLLWAATSHPSTHDDTHHKGQAHTPPRDDGQPTTGTPPTHPPAASEQQASTRATTIWLQGHKEGAARLRVPAAATPSLLISQNCATTTTHQQCCHM